MARRRQPTRVRSSADVRRMASAVSHPGIDPREWLQLMVVREVGFDAAEGIFVDLINQMSGLEETAYLGSSYAGNGFGAHWPVEVGDTVLVATPGGDPGLGPVIVCRWNNSGDPPPTDFRSADDEEDATKNPTLRVQPGRNYVVRASQGGGFDFRVEGDGTITISSAQGVLNLQDAGQSFVRGEDYADAESNFLDALEILAAAINAANTAAGGPGITPAAEAFGLAVDAFKNARNTYLSSRIKGE